MGFGECGGFFSGDVGFVWVFVRRYFMELKVYQNPEAES